MLVDVSKGNSLFRLIPTFWLGHENCNKRPIHRICSLMRKVEADSALISEIINDIDFICKEKKALESRFNESLNFKIYQISFFEKKYVSWEEIKKDPEFNCISTSYVINFQDNNLNWISYVFFSVVSKPYIKINGIKTGLLNNYINSNRIYNLEIHNDDDIINAELNGTCFFQQNTITSVCSHSAICTALNNSNKIDYLVFPEHLNDVLGIDHISKQIGNVNTTITIKEIADLFKHYGFELDVKNWFDENLNEKYFEHVYKYFESKCPSLLVFSTKEGGDLHIVPILGHTFNTDLWRPEAERSYNRKVGDLGYKDTSAWVDHFVINDDNFGTFHCLPIDALWRPTIPKFDPSFRAAFTLSLVPKEVTTPADHGEWANITILEAIIKFFIRKNLPMNFWISELCKSVLDAKKRTPFVARTFLITKSEYLNSIQVEDFEGKKFTNDELIKIESDLEDIFWLTEISLPDLYTANKTKIADFIYSSKVDPSKKFDINFAFDSWLLVRLPGYLLRKSQENTPEFITTLSIDSHFPIARSCQEDFIIEW